MVAGVDEVGRGALCGPVVAGAVVLGDGFDAGGLDDSKRLTARQREALAERIREQARGLRRSGSPSHEEIDRLNILRATHLAMQRAVEALRRRRPTCSWSTRCTRARARGPRSGRSSRATRCRSRSPPPRSWPRWRATRMMRECDQRYPGYGLAHNMGYAQRGAPGGAAAPGPVRDPPPLFPGDVTQRWLFS